MRRDGKKLDPDAIKATGAVLRIVYRRHPLGQPTFEARAFDVVTGAETDHLTCANINLVDQGVRIGGYEPFSLKPQLWWCVPLTPEQNAEVSEALRLRPTAR